MKKRKTFNESFMDAYKDNNLSSYDLDTKAHVELSPAFAGAVESSKKIRDNMKDAFKEQDKLVKDFLSLQDLEENPKIKSRPELKAMKLSESLNEDYSNFIGRPLKDFLYNIDGRTILNVDFENKDTSSGFKGFQGMARQLPWYTSDKIIKDIQLGDDRYYKFKILTESKVLNESSIEDMIKAFENRIDELEDVKTESLKESASEQDALSKCSAVYKRLQDIVKGSDATQWSIKDIIQRLFRAVDGKVRIKEASNRYVSYDGAVKDYTIGGSASLEYLKGDLNRLAEDLTMAVYKTNGGTKISYTPALIKTITDSKNESLKESGNSFNIKDQVQRYIVKKLEEEINDITAQEIASKISGYDLDWCPAEITPLSTRLRTQINYHILVIAGALTKMLFEEAPEQIRESVEEPEVVEPVISFPGSAVNVWIRSNGEYVMTKGWDWDKLIVDGNDLIFDRKKFRITPQEYKKLKSVIFNESLNEAKQKLNEWTFTLTTNNVNDYIDSNVPLEDLGMMAWKWMSNDDLVDMLRANEYGFEEEDEIDDDLDESLNEANKPNNLPKDKVRSYKIVASDTDDNIVFVKKVNGYNQIIKHLDILKGNIPEGATQIYVTRDDDKEVYSAFINDDGTLDVLEDNLIMEMDDGDRPSLLNKVQADLGTESAADAKALRELSRKGKGQVGFDEHEIGFMDDTFHLNSRNMKQINWAKEVADHYGFTYSDVKTIMKDGEERYYIDIYAPGISDDPLLGEE